MGAYALAVGAGSSQREDSPAQPIKDCARPFNTTRRAASLAIPPLLQQEGPVEPPAEGGLWAAARGQLHL